jgi:environmental stress-induced protein Ves
MEAMIKVVRVEERVVTAWKNGRGWTSTLVISPENATLDSFDWRISIAGTDQAGPFSAFPGIDRTLLMLEGRARLMADQVSLILDSDSDPIAFAGDVPTSAELLADAIVDFNVMTRRGRFTHRVVRKTLPAPELLAASSVSAVLVLNGSVKVQTDDAESTVNPGDLAVIYGDIGKVQVAPEGKSVIVQVTIARVRAS